MAIDWLVDKSHHSATEHRASTRILLLTLFLASVLISAQIFLNPLASSSTVLHHVFLSLPLPRSPWGFQCRACLAISSDGFRSVCPSHPNLRFLICKCVLGCFVRFHSSLFVIWSSQKIFNILLGYLLIKTCCLAVILWPLRVVIWFPVGPLFSAFQPHVDFLLNPPNFLFSCLMDASST